MVHLFTSLLNKWIVLSIVEKASPSPRKSGGFPEQINRRRTSAKNRLDNLRGAYQISAHNQASREEKTMLQHTRHSAVRSAQRGLTEEEIEYVYQFASRYHCNGAVIYYLRRQDVPLSDHRLDFAMRLVGTALVLDQDGRTLLTAWRNRRRGMKLIRKKDSYRTEADTNS